MATGDRYTKEELMAKFRASGNQTSIDLGSLPNSPSRQTQQYERGSQKITENGLTAPRGAREQAKDFLGGVVSGFSAPGRTIQRGLSKGVEAVTGVEGFGAPEEKQFDTTAGKVGEFVGEAGTFVGPGAAASSVTRGAPMAVRAGTQALTSAGQESLNVGEFGKSSIAAGATDLALPVAGKILGGLAEVAKGMTGGLTAAGKEAVEAALERPGAAFRAAGGDVTEGLKGLSQSIRTGVRELYKRAGDEYAELVSQAGIKEIPKEKIVDDVQSIFTEQADVGVGKKGLSFKNTPFTDTEERQLEKVYDLVRTWDDNTPQGINTLARRVSRFRRGTEDFANFDRIIDSVRRQIRGVAGEVAPSIKEANQRFAQKMDMLDEVDNVLKTDPDLGTKEGLRKTAERLTRIFGSGKEFTREAIEDLEKELNIDILGTLAGQQLGEIAPRSTSRLGGAVDAFTQPVSAVTARNLVPAIGAIRNAVQKIPGIAESTRATIVNTVADLFRNPDSELPDNVKNGEDDRNRQ